jgi:hypothetical protein
MRMAETRHLHVSACIGRFREITGGSISMIDEDAAPRTCSKCGNEKPRAEFYRNLLQCRQCKSSIRAAYRDSRRDEIAAYKLIYRAANKQKISNYQAGYCSANAEEIAKRRAIYAVDNAEKVALRGANYRSNNREKIAKQKAAWSARLPDYLIAYRLSMYSNVLTPADIPQELIDSRRAVIKLKRLIKEMTNEKC